MDFTKRTLEQNNTGFNNAIFQLFNTLRAKWTLLRTLEQTKNTGFNNAIFKLFNTRRTKWTLLKEHLNKTTLDLIMLFFSYLTHLELNGLY